MAIDYITQYTSNIYFRMQTDMRLVRPGQVIMFYYKRRERRIALVLNPVAVDKIHLLKLNDIPFEEFQRRIRPYVTVVKDIVDKKVAHQELYRDLRPKIEGMGCYRTYYIKDISNIEIIDLIRTTAKEEKVEKVQLEIAKGEYQHKEDLTKDSV